MKCCGYLRYRIFTHIIFEQIKRGLLRVLTRRVASSDQPGHGLNDVLRSSRIMINGPGPEPLISGAIFCPRSFARRVELFGFFGFSPLIPISDKGPTCTE